MKKRSNKIFAVICAIAVVICSMTIQTQKNVEVAAADEDNPYVGLTYTAIANATSSELSGTVIANSEYAFYEGSDISSVFHYEGAGLKNLYIALQGNFPTSAKVNGSSDNITILNDQLFIYDADTVLTYAYNVIEFTVGTTNYILIIYCPTGTGVYDSTEEPASGETTTEAPAEDYDWTAFGIGVGGVPENTYYYDAKSINGIDVVNIQLPGFVSEAGTYVTVASGISSVNVNGTEYNDCIQGAGACIPLSAYTKYINTVTITHATGTGTMLVKNASMSEEETTTQEETTTPEETTTQNGANITVSGDIELLGYQISTSSEGIRAAAGVEPTINGQKVTAWGFVYGLANYKDTDTGITDDDMYVREDNDFVKSYQSTSVGTLDVQLGDSATATYFARTLLFGAFNATAYKAQYKVRAYAVLSDGSYVYSDISEYSIAQVADKLYQGRLMNSVTSHNYLYDTILSKVYEGYEEVDFQWNNSIVKPEQVEE